MALQCRVGGWSYTWWIVRATQAHTGHIYHHMCANSNHRRILLLVRLQLIRPSTSAPLNYCFCHDCGSGLYLTTSVKHTTGYDTTQYQMPRLCHGDSLTPQNSLSAPGGIVMGSRWQYLAETHCCSQLLSSARLCTSPLHQLTGCVLSGPWSQGTSSQMACSQGLHN